MDKQLVDALGPDGAGVEVIDEHGRVRLPNGTEHQLKPLAELYAAPPAAIDEAHEKHLQLALEATILEHDHSAGLTDGAVLLAVDALAMNPEAPPRDGLSRDLQLALRVHLSLRDYDRQAVRQVARRIAKAVQLHVKRGGQRAYLDYIHSHVPHHHH